MMYLIDTNICIYLIMNRNELVRKRIEEEKPYQVAVSAVSAAELAYGAAKSRHIEQIGEYSETFYRPLKSFRSTIVMRSSSESSGHYWKNRDNLSVSMI